MRLNKFLSVALLAAIVLTGCKKNYVPVGDHPFEISITRLEATRAVVDVIPDNNDFNYIFGVIDTVTYDVLGEQLFIETVDELLKSIYKVLYDTDNLDRFQEVLYRGAYDQVEKDLKPDTWYWAYAFPYDGNNPVGEKMTKVLFKTLASKVSDIKFSVALNGSVATVTPSNGDQYFWDYCSLEEAKQDYGGYLDYFYTRTIDLYWSYGFLESMLDKGAPSSEDMSDYYEMKAGDQFCLVASGYDEGISSEIECYLLTYNGEGQPGKVEKIGKKLEGEVLRGLALQKKFKSDYSANRMSLKRLNR